MERTEAVADDLQLRFSGSDARPRSKAACDLVDMSLIVAVGVKLLGQVEVGGRIGLIALLQHSHDNIGLGVETNGATHQVPVAAEPVAPEVVSQDRKFTGIRRVFLSRKSSPQDGLGPKYIEEAPGDVNGIHGIRSLPGAQIKTDAAWVVGCHGLKLMRLAPSHELGNRNRLLVTAGEVAMKVHNPFRIGKWQRTQEDMVQDRKNRSVGADAQRQGNGCHQRKPRALDENTERMAEIG